MSATFDSSFERASIWDGLRKLMNEETQEGARPRQMFLIAGSAWQEPWKSYFAWLKFGISNGL